MGQDKWKAMFYIDIENKMGTRPNTGIGAILDLLQFPIKELYITGFTFLLKSAPYMSSLPLREMNLAILYAIVGCIQRKRVINTFERITFFRTL